MDNADIADKVLASVETLQKLFEEFSGKQRIVTSKFICQLVCQRPGGGRLDSRPEAGC